MSGDCKPVGDIPNYYVSGDYRPIGGIGNYYGGLWVKKAEGRFYWSIENYDGHGWEEIPESLFRALVTFQLSPRGPLTCFEEDNK